ncbi:ATP-binding protein, partial [Paraburkholderia nemoris]|uniref:ATP-binding protein n=1 Tax=Paraburkholderia nemoris TaxID=2793076 RepID=UPI0038BB31F6
ILIIQSSVSLLRQEWQVLEEVVGGALRVSSQRLSGCVITTQLPVDFTLFRFDTVLIERVLVNLVENAAKFAGPEAHIGIAAVARGAWAEISVYDNGPGIPGGNEQRLFERFSGPGSAMAKPCHGLGLSICRAIVEAHGGMIGASPSPYGGAGFTFALPMELPVPRAARHGEDDQALCG